jgi:transposase
MRSFRTPERDIALLFANINLNTVAPIGSPVYTIDRLVEQLDTRKIESRYDLESAQGKEPIHPKTLIKVALYAMHNCRFSLRKMEADTGQHLGYRWLTGDVGIDHSTMGKFLAKYKEEIKDLFAQVVLIAMEKELIDFEVLAIDTVKIRANASYKQFKTEERINKDIEKIKLKIGELIENVDREKEIEIEALKKREARLEEAAFELRGRIEMKGNGIEQKKPEKINITDFDCKLVQQANGEINSGYGITTAMDTKTDIVTFFDLTEEGDAKALLPTIEGSKETTGQTHEVAAADSGFSSTESLKKLEEAGQAALIPDKRMEVESRGETAKGEYDRSKFGYNKEKDQYQCPTGETLEKTGSFQMANGKRYNKYENPAACTGCPQREKCTKGNHRTVSRDVDEEVKERMREKFEDEANQELYKKRAHSAESPFGQIKHNLKYRIFQRRTAGKIMLECAMLFMLHNILKIGEKCYC